MKNVIFVISDQMQRYAALESPVCKMDGLRRLCREGVEFPNAHTVNPICSPARASLITGKLPHNHGMVDCTHTVPEYRAQYDRTSKSLPEALKDSGYHISYYGKWHIERSYKLEDFGIDEYETEKAIPKARTTPISRIVIKTKGYKDSTICGVYEEDESHSEEHYIYDRTMAFIDKHLDSRESCDKPFCSFISTYAPHDPYVVPKEVYDLYEGVDFRVPEDWEDEKTQRPMIYHRLHEVWRDLTQEQIKTMIRCYYSACTLVDIQLQRLVSFLKDRGIYQDTMIVFLSDHGDMVGSHGLFCKGVTAFEQQYSIPLVMKLPQERHAGLRCMAYADTCDVLPTVLDELGIPALKGIDGKSLLPFLSSDALHSSYSVAEFFGQRYSYTQRVIWSEGFKYVFNAFDYDELYDLNRDPGETTNLISDPGLDAVKEKLVSLIWQRARETQDTYILDAQYFMHRFLPIGPSTGNQASAQFEMYNKTF
ncbi:MAG: sulfatase-like hydrolase/transferase [Sphaerochaetaceae bacterium]|jgi:arylsulfatase A-like enzyme|nr:sulfatase-like hydrolase/transferase [Sphaerochaetaceae bacterium]